MFSWPLCGQLQGFLYGGRWTPSRPDQVGQLRPTLLSDYYYYCPTQRLAGCNLALWTKGTPGKNSWISGYKASTMPWLGQESQDWDSCSFILAGRLFFLTSLVCLHIKSGQIQFPHFLQFSRFLRLKFLPDLPEPQVSSGISVMVFVWMHSAHRYKNSELNFCHFLQAYLLGVCWQVSTTQHLGSSC